MSALLMFIGLSIFVIVMFVLFIAAIIFFAPFVIVAMFIAMVIVAIDRLKEKKRKKKVSHE